jgi:hypothetical protein
MAQVSRVLVGIVPTLIVAANGNRKAMMIKNDGTASIFLANSDQVTVADGLVLPQGVQLNVEGDTDAYWGICAAGTQQVNIVEIL